MNKTAIIVAAGSGSRAGGPVPKQLQSLAGKPVFIHSIERFLEEDPDTLIVLVVSKKYSEIFQTYIRHMHFTRSFECLVVEGGATRAESVRSGLFAAGEESDALVAVHDAARPLLSVDLVRRGWEAAIEHGAAVPVVPLTDSIREKTDGEHSVNVPRDRYVAVQTPQVFKARLLAEAYRRLADPGAVTDDASVIEQAGGSVALFDGETTNIKITGPEDLKIASILMKR